MSHQVQFPCPLVCNAPANHSQDSKFTPPSNSSISTSIAPNPSHTGPIARGVIGGVAAVFLCAGLLYFCLRRRRHRENRSKEAGPPVNYLSRPTNLYEMNSKRSGKGWQEMEGSRRLDGWRYDKNGHEMEGGLAPEMHGSTVDGRGI